MPSRLEIRYCLKSVVRLLLMIICSGFAMSLPAVAEDALYVRGDMSCKQFINMQTSDQAEAHRYVYWLGGVLTGHSIASGKALGKGVNIACVNAYVVDYCKNTVGSPDLSEGVVKLLSELERGDNDYLNSDGCRLN